jgi:hypothetical protein
MSCWAKPNKVFEYVVVALNAQSHPRRIRRNHARRLPEIHLQLLTRHTFHPAEGQLSNPRHQAALPVSAATHSSFRINKRCSRQSSRLKSIKGKPTPQNHSPFPCPFA